MQIKKKLSNHFAAFRASVFINKKVKDTELLFLSYGKLNGKN